LHGTSIHWTTTEVFSCVCCPSCEVVDHAGATPRMYSVRYQMLLQANELMPRWRDVGEVHFGFFVPTQISARRCLACLSSSLCYLPVTWKLSSRAVSALGDFLPLDPDGCPTTLSRFWSAIMRARNGRRICYWSRISDPKLHLHRYRTNAAAKPHILSPVEWACKRSRG
jgi:hypothetical protein